MGVQVFLKWLTRERGNLLSFYPGSARDEADSACGSVRPIQIFAWAHSGQTHSSIGRLTPMTITSSGSPMRQ
jgi:hypothetical protein